MLINFKAHTKIFIFSLYITFLNSAQEDYKIDLTTPLINSDELIDEEPGIHIRKNRCNQICNYLSSIKNKFKSSILNFLSRYPNVLNSVSIVTPIAVETSLGYAATLTTDDNMLKGFAGPATAIASLPIINLLYKIINYKAINCTNVQCVKLSVQFASTAILIFVSLTSDLLIFSLFIPQDSVAFNTPINITLWILSIAVPKLCFICIGPQRPWFQHFKHLITFPFNFLIISPINEFKNFLQISIKNNDFKNQYIQLKESAHLPKIIEDLSIGITNFPCDINNIVCQYLPKPYDLNHFMNGIKYISKSEDNLLERDKIFNIIFDYVDDYSNERISVFDAIEQQEAQG